jgi:hypothetical protein
MYQKIRVYFEELTIDFEVFLGRVISGQVGFLWGFCAKGIRS